VIVLEREKSCWIVEIEVEVKDAVGGGGEGRRDAAKILTRQGLFWGTSELLTSGQASEAKSGRNLRLHRLSSLNDNKNNNSSKLHPCGTVSHQFPASSGATNMISRPFRVQ